MPFREAIIAASVRFELCTVLWSISEIVQMQGSGKAWEVA